MPAIDPNLIIEAIQTLTSDLPNHAKKIYANIIVLKTWLWWKAHENLTKEGIEVLTQEQKQHKEMEDKLATLYGTVHGEAELDYDSILKLLNPNDNPTMKDTIKELFDLQQKMMGRSEEEFFPQDPDYVFFIFSLMTSDNFPEITHNAKNEEEVRNEIVEYIKESNAKQRAQGLGVPSSTTAGGTKKNRNQKSKKSKKSSKRKTRR